MSVREVTVTLKIRDVFITLKARDIQATTDTNRVVYSSGYSTVQVWGDTTHLMSELSGTFGNYP